MEFRCSWLVPVVGVASFIAVASCSADDSSESLPADERSGMGGGATSENPDPSGSHDAGWGTGGGSAMYDSGSASGDEQNAEPRPGESADAGEPDAPAPTCDQLDSSKPTVLYLSADDSNSMASPAIARRLIRNSGTVPANLIRTYEFLNYYNVPFEAAAKGSLRIVAQATAGAADTDVELQIGVQAEAPAVPRRPMTITLVLDTSGSMSNTPIELERRVVLALTGQLRAGDIVSAVTWSTSNNTILSGHVVTEPNDPVLQNMAKQLEAGGGTDLHSGLARGYQLAQEHYGAHRTNRVVLISDGQANVGITDETFIGEMADDENKEGIYMVGVGVGDGVNDTLMDVVTDAGNGAYVYIDTADEANKMFGARFDEVMEVSARAVQVRMTVPWYFGMYKFNGEEYSTDPAKVKPQHLAPGDAMVFHQVLRACDASKIVASDPVEFAATWKHPLTYFENTVAVPTTVGEMMASAGPELKRGRAIVAYAEMLKTMASVESDQRKALIDSVAAVVADANAAAPSPELQEIAELIEQYRVIAQ